MSSEEQIKKYVESLNNIDFEVRKNAIWKLGTMGKAAQKAVQALIQALNESEDELYYLATYALEKIGKETKEVFPELIEALKDENLRTSYGAERILGKIGRDSNQAHDVALEIIKALKDQQIDENTVNDSKMYNSCMMILEKLYRKIEDPHLHDTINDMLKNYD